MSEGANAGTTSLIQPGLPALEWRLNQEYLYSSKMMIRPPGRPRNSWLSFVLKDMKGVGIPDTMVMGEDRLRWKRVVAAHACLEEETVMRSGTKAIAVLTYLG